MTISKPHTSLPKQDPAAYVPGTPTLGQYQPMSAPRCRPTPLTRTKECDFWKGFDYGLPSWPPDFAGGASQVALRPTAHVCHVSVVNFALMEAAVNAHFGNQVGHP